MNRKRRVIGIDPGFGRCGWGVIEASGQSLTLIAAGCITTPARIDIGSRLLQLHTELSALLELHTPETVAIEQLFFSKNVTTGIGVGQARGVALLAAAERGIPVHEFSPSNVKQSVTGYGRADKHQVQHMLRMLVQGVPIPKSDDAADAIAIAICGSLTRLPVA